MDLRNECVWFDQVKYEVAEASYQTLLANRHCGLKVEGKAIPHNPISSGIERAMNLIGNSLKSAPINVASTDLEKRVTELEKQNNELKLAMDKILDRLSVLEGRTIQQNGGGKVDDDDDFNLFGSDDEKETPSQNVQKCIGKKKKPPAVAKSSLVLDVKPWDDETDISDMETKVRSVSTDGLVWGASKILPVAYGIKKLQISCVVEDDKVGTDFLEESITAFEDLVQSVDIVAFNKI